MELPEVSLGASCGSSRLDLSTQVLYDVDDEEIDEFGDMRVAMARSNHERAHWVRFHGTSVGYLLNVLRATRDETAMTALRKVGPDSRKLLLAKRESGKRLWSIQEPYDPSIAGENFALSGQAWVDSYWLWNALVDMSPITKIRSHPEESAPYALADAWLASEGILQDAPYPGNLSARSWLRGPVFHRASGEGPLTTRLLWECASTLCELMPPELEDWDSVLPVDELLDSDSWAEDHQMLARITLRDTAYGIPARTALSFESGLSVAGLALLIDFALNPPLPMLGGETTGVAWAGFYPPERFWKCVKFGPELTVMLRGWKTEFEDVSRAYDLLASLSGLTYFKPPRSLLHRVPSVRQAIDGENPFHNALVSNSAKLLWLREKVPEMIVMPHSERWDPRVDERFDLSVPGYRGDPSPTSPMVSVSGSMSAVAAFPFGRREAHRYLQFGAVSRVLDSIVNEIGPLSLAIPKGYDEEVLQSEAIGELADTVKWSPEEISALIRTG